MTATAGTQHWWLMPGYAAPRRGGGQGRPRSVRDWAVDLTVVVLAVVVGVAASASTWVPDPPHGPRWLEPVDIAIGIASLAAIFTRRRFPVGSAVALLPVAVLSPAGTGVVGAVIFSLAVHARTPRVVVVAILQVLAGTAGSLVYRVPGDAVWISVVLTVVLEAMVVAWGTVVRARRLLVESLREQAEGADARAQLLADQSRARERARIATEMHDVLAHRLSLLSVHAGALEFRPDAPPEQIAHAAGVIRASAHQALEDLREAIGVLRDPSAGSPSRPQPTVADISGLVAEAREAGMRLSVHTTLTEPDRIPAGLGRTAYRVVQECLTNARKHAPGVLVELRVDGMPGRGLRVAVANPLPVGSLDTPIPGGGSGLVGLGERVQLAGGTLRTSLVGGIFRVLVTLPWLDLGGSPAPADGDDTAVDDTAVDGNVGTAAAVTGAGEHR